MGQRYRATGRQWSVSSWSIKIWAQINIKPHHTQGLIPSIPGHCPRLFRPLIFLIALGKLMWHCGERWQGNKCWVTYHLTFICTEVWKWSAKRNAAYMPGFVCNVGFTVINSTPCRMPVTTQKRAKIISDLAQCFITPTKALDNNRE